MAIKALKDIINNKGYQITANDRKVFEEENNLEEKIKF